MGVMKPVVEKWQASLGAVPSDHGTTFRVWAPKAKTVEAVLESKKPSGERHKLEAGADGFFSAPVPGAAPGQLYRFCVDGQLYGPDPASRYQPQGVHGPSQIVDPGAFE